MNENDTSEEEKNGRHCYPHSTELITVTNGWVLRIFFFFTFTFTRQIHYSGPHRTSV